MRTISVCLGLGRKLAVGVAWMAVGAALTIVGGVGASAPVDPSSEVLVALAQRVEVSHREVDRLLARGEVERALSVLESVCAGPWPTSSPADPIVTELHHDACGRLLRLRLDNPDVAPQPWETSLALAQRVLGDRTTPANPFTARLTGIEGELYEQLHDDDAALSAYESALELNRVLLERELGAATPRG